MGEATVPDRHAELVSRLMAWAESDDNLQAVIQTGSSSRGPDRADRFSDRDIEIIARDPAPLLTDDGWIHRLGNVMVAQYLANGDDPDTRLVFFDGGRKIDFTIAGRSRLDEMTETGRLNDLYERGYRVLLDKDGLTAGLPAATGAAPRRPLPSAAAFGETVSEFWFEAAHMPTYLVRGELWVVKFRDWTMKEMLLRMLEWHALATRGPETDTWYIGTKMHRWVEADTWREVRGVFSRFDLADSWRGLVAMMALFARLTHETAAALGLDYPVGSEQAVIAYVMGFEEAIARLEDATES